MRQLTDGVEAAATDQANLRKPFGTIVPVTLGDSDLLARLAPTTRRRFIRLRLCLMKPDRADVFRTQTLQQVAAHIRRQPSPWVPHCTRRPLVPLKLPPGWVSFLAAWNRSLGETIRHAGLPARASRAPTRYHLRRQPKRNELTRTRRAWSAALVDDGTAQHLVGQFRKFLVLRAANAVRVNALQIRL